MTDAAATAPTVAALLATAVELHNAGKPAEAEPLYLEALRRSPGHPDALHLSGVAARQLGRPTEAVLRIAAAAARSPGLPGLHQNLNRAVLSLGDPAAVAANCAQALAERPDDDGLRLLLLQTLAAQARQAVAAGRSVAPPPLKPPERAGRGESAISVVVCSIDPVKHARFIAGMGRALASRRHQIISIHDATSLCEGYARGLERCDGDIVILCHDDIEILNLDFADRLESRLGDWDVIGVVGTTQLSGPTWMHAGRAKQHGVMAHPARGWNGFRIETYGAGSEPVGGAQALDGVFIAGRTDTVRRIGFDAANFDGFHLYDLDFSYRAYLAGLRTAICPDIWLIHQSAGRMDAVWRRYAERFLGVHAATLPPPTPSGPNPLRAVWLENHDEIRAFHALAANFL